jgi:hypothetical protein
MDVVMCTDEGGHVGPQVETESLGKMEGGGGAGQGSEEGVQARPLLPNVWLSHLADEALQGQHQAAHRLAHGHHQV